MSTYNDHSNPEQLQRDIARTRAMMGDTLEMLRHKLSPGELLDQALSYLKDSGVGQFSRNLGATVQHHPIPVALLGISIAWLMLVGSREVHPSRPWTTTERARSRVGEGAGSMADQAGQSAQVVHASRQAAQDQGAVELNVR